MTEGAQKPVLLWFRKDLRLDDNHALQQACESGRPVIPLYIREPEGHGTGPLGAAQRWWLHHSLTALRNSLRSHGSNLVFASGDPLAVIASLLDKTGADVVVWNRRYDPAGVSADSRVKEELRKRGITASSFAGQLLHEPTRLLTSGGTPYRLYSPFWHAFKKAGEPNEPIAVPQVITAPKSWPRSEELANWGLLPSQPNWAAPFSTQWTPGEAGARQRLDNFIEETLPGYTHGRDFPAKPLTSMISPHLALGEISPARLWHATRGLSAAVQQNNITHFRKELAWREFSYHQLFHFPHLPYANWNNRFDGFPWRFDPGLFEAWTRGLTGYPIVDAGMRQLWKFGWMHNRVRMIAASFLIKDLLIDWRRGEAWFRDTLVDADPASNAASWQWVAGCGADASPFFRIFNPVQQGEKFDPDGSYVRKFVPELTGLDAKYIHRPFEAPEAALKQAGIVLGETYPYPLVDHVTARDRALAAYKALAEAA